MSDELKKMFEELIDFDWLSTYQNFVGEVEAKVEEELKTSRQRELEKIKTEIEEYKSTIDNAISEDELKIEGMKEAYSDSIKIIGKHIAELKGEQDV